MPNYISQFARKKSIRCSIYFVLIFLFLDIAIPYSYLFLLNKLNLKKSYNYEYSGILVLGDSHGSFGIDPETLNQSGETAHSYAKGGHYSEFNYYLYKNLQARFEHPKKVIVSIPYFYLDASENDDIFLALGDNDFSRYYISNIFSPPYSNLFKYKMSFQNFPSYLFYKVKNKAYTDYGYAINTNPNFIVTDLSQTYTESKNSDTIDFVKDGHSKNDEKNARSLYYFRKLLDEFGKDNVTVFLVEVPEYIDTQEKLTGKEIFYREIEEEIQKYSNIYFIKQRDIPEIDPRDKTLFFDAGMNSHMSLKGSKFYTRLLIKKMSELRPVCRECSAPKL